MTKREFFEDIRDNAPGNWAYDGDTVCEFRFGDVDFCLFAAVEPDRVTVVNETLIHNTDYFTSFDFFIVLRPDMTLEEFVAEATLKLLEFIDEEKDFIVKGRPFASYLY